MICNIGSLLFSALLFFPCCENFKLLPQSPRRCLGWLKVSKSSGLDVIAPVYICLQKSRRGYVLKCKQSTDSGDDMSTDVDTRGTRFMKARPIIPLVKSVSRFFSRVIGNFCSKYGPIQRFLRGFLFEFKIAKRAWRQESKRSQDEFQRQRQIDVFESLSDADILNTAQIPQQVNGTGASKFGVLRTDNEIVWESEEARLECEQQIQFYNALGIFDSIDEDEEILSFEYDKYLSYTSGKLLQ